MTPPTESWFDRLAATPHTRRQGMKAAVIGAAAAVGAGLPFARSVPTASADANDCRKGCVYSANQSYANRAREVTFGFASFTVSAEAVLAGPLGPAVALYGLFASRSQTRILDEGIAAHRKDVVSCFQPGCSGYDPYSEGGPCAGCEQPMFCNPCAVLEQGYICCVYAPKDCHGDCCPTTVTNGCP
jgi:hypothetical protein